MSTNDLVDISNFTIFLLERIEKIESAQLTQQLDPQVWKFVTERLDEIEGKMMSALSIEAYVNLNERLLELEEHIKSMTEGYLKKVIANAVPHRCPVCNGYGSAKVDEKTHATPRAHLIENDPCNSCKGTGIIWG